MYIDACKLEYLGVKLEKRKEEETMPEREVTK
jgi:hypothetical protein